MKIAILSGSQRQGSLHQQLAQHSAQQLTQQFAQQGVDAQLVSLQHYPLPIYCEDIEREGFAPEVGKLRSLLASCQALVIASPEYNGSVTPLLKNTLDWVSRPAPGTEQLRVFTDKPALVVSTAPGSSGGLRAGKHLCDILNNLGALVLPRQVCIANSYQAFNKEGQLVSEKYLAVLNAELARLVRLTQTLTR